MGRSLQKWSSLRVRVRELLARYSVSSVLLGPVADFCDEGANPSNSLTLTLFVKIMLRVTRAGRGRRGQAAAVQRSRFSYSSYRRPVPNRDGQFSLYLPAPVGTSSRTVDVRRRGVQ